MDFYDIITLIIFFEDQSKLDFAGIKEVVSVLKNPKIPKEKKGDIMVGILKKYGLNEIEYPLYNETGELMNIVDTLPKDDPEDFCEEVPDDIPDEIQWNKYSTGGYVVDLYVCKLQDGEKRFYQILN